MKKLLFVLTLCAQGLYGAAAAKPFDVLVKNESRKDKLIAKINFITLNNADEFMP